MTQCWHLGNDVSGLSIGALQIGLIVLTETSVTIYKATLRSYEIIHLMSSLAGSRDVLLPSLVVLVPPLLVNLPLTLSANSHKLCCSYAAPKPFPCHVVPLKVYIVSFPFDIHSGAVFDAHKPCRARAMPRPCRFESNFSRPRLSAAWAWHVWISVGRPETACRRPARVRLLPATTRSSTNDVIRSRPIR
jgi:hypothetical protein